MAKKERRTITSSKASIEKSSRCLPIAERGIETGPQFAALMSALMTDLITGCITPEIGNATCNAGGKLLKIVEMQHKYGKQNSAPLKLTAPQGA